MASLIEPRVGIGADGLDAMEPARFQAAKEGKPARAVFAGDDGEAQPFAAAVLVRRDGDHAGDPHDAAAPADHIADPAIASGAPVI